MIFHDIFKRSGAFKQLGGVWVCNPTGQWAGDPSPSRTSVAFADSSYYLTLVVSCCQRNFIDVLSLIACSSKENATATANTTKHFFETSNQHFHPDDRKLQILCRSATKLSDVSSQWSIRHSEAIVEALNESNADWSERFCVSKVTNSLAPVTAYTNPESGWLKQAKQLFWSVLSVWHLCHWPSVVTGDIVNYINSWRGHTG